MRKYARKMNETFRLDSARIRKKLILQEGRKTAWLVKNLGVSRRTVVAMLCEGHVPVHGDTLERLAGLMGCEPTELLIPRRAKRTA